MDRHLKNLTFGGKVELHRFPSDKQTFNSRETRISDFVWKLHGV